MLVAVPIALLGLALVAVSARPGDGRAETAVVVPLLAAVAVVVPVIAVVALAGAAIAYATVRIAARRTLTHGRRLRAIAALAGATAPLGALTAAVAVGASPEFPELWLVGAVVPGILADDVRRQPADRRGAVAVGGVVTLLALALSGLLLGGTLAGADVGTLLAASTGGGLAVGSLTVLTLVLLPALAVGVVARWRYALHAGVVSVPLLAVWTVESVAVPVLYLLAATASAVAIAALQPRLRLPGRKLAATVGLVGATVGAAGVVAGAPVLPAVLAGALGAEDARCFGKQAGADLLDGVALGGSLYVLAVVAILTAIAAGGAVSGVLIGSGVLLAIVTLGLVVARRERQRPSEIRLRAAEGRWVR